MKYIISAIIVITLTVFLMLNFSSQPNNNPHNNMDLKASEFKEKITTQPGVVIDVRTDEEYNNGHLALTDYQFNFLDGEFENQLDQMDKDQTYYLYCRTGNRSGKAAELMKENGFDNVYNVGGFEDLANSGFETNQPD